MIGRLVLPLYCFAALSQTIFGAPIGLFDGLPDSFTPGQPVVFDVRLPSLVNLGAYNIDVVVEGSAGVPGTDFYFDVVGTIPAASNYVFPSTDYYFDAVNVELPSRHRITLSDFDFVGVNVLPDSNDRVATVELRTLPSFSASLQLYVDVESLILDTPDATPTPVDGFEVVKNDIASLGSVELPAVPEPASIIEVMFAVSAILVGNHRQGKCKKSSLRKPTGRRS